MSYPSGPLSPSITEPISPIDLSLPEQQELGYMPLRDDFERVSTQKLKKEFADIHVVQNGKIED